jgi:uncharacterized membrane protein (UPF0127 family)
MKRFFLIIIASLAVFQLPLSFTEEPKLGDHALVLLPDGREISVQVVVSEEERKRGLMFREELEENEGMFFVFEEDGFHSFWMKNCKIALDIIWMDAHKRIVHIKEEAQPCRESEDCPTIFPARKARYALEVKAGVVSASQVKIGDALLFIPLSDRAAPRSKK